MAYDATKDDYADRPIRSVTAPARKLVEVTPADAELPAYLKAAWAYCPLDVAGDVGTVRVVAVDNLDAEYVDVLLLPGLQPLPPVQLRRVMETGTTTGVVVYGLLD